jgi:hypothetical protein
MSSHTGTLSNHCAPEFVPSHHLAFTANAELLGHGIPHGADEYHIAESCDSAEAFKHFQVEASRGFDPRFVDWMQIEYPGQKLTVVVLNCKIASYLLKYAGIPFDVVVKTGRIYQIDYVVSKSHSINLRYLRTYFTQLNPSTATDLKDSRSFYPQLRPKDRLDSHPSSPSLTSICSHPVTSLMNELFPDPVIPITAKKRCR